MGEKVMFYRVGRTCELPRKEHQAASREETGCRVCVWAQWVNHWIGSVWCLHCLPPKCQVWQRTGEEGGGWGNGCSGLLLPHPAAVQGDLGPCTPRPPVITSTRDLVPPGMPRGLRETTHQEGQKVWEVKTTQSMQTLGKSPTAWRTHGLNL